MAKQGSTFVLPMNTPLLDSWLDGYCVVGDTNDPDHKRWRRGATDVNWTRDPMGVCHVVIDGHDPELAARLPTMPLAEVARLIGARDVSDAHAGLRAASLLRDPRLVGALARRVQDADVTVAAQAIEALADISGAALQRGTNTLGSALFSLPGWRHEKLQVLRSFRRKMPTVTRHAAECVAQALRDDDWEVRATAVLAAGRIDLQDLRETVEKVGMPDQRAQGLTRREGQALLAIRAAVVEQLGRDQNPRVPEQMRRAVAGDARHLPADLSLIFHALVTPTPLMQGSAPAHPSITADDAGLLHCPDGHPVAWIPPGDFALGDPVANTDFGVRRFRDGYFIDIAWRGIGDLAQARAAADACARRFGCSVSLVNSDQLERAARGPDGRRFPWGMNATRAVWADLSPFGLRDLVQKTGEWLADTNATSGGAKAPACAQRLAASLTAKNGYRFVFVNGRSSP